MGGFIIKRFFATILAAALALSLTACDSKDYSTDFTGLFSITTFDMTEEDVIALEGGEDYEVTDYDDSKLLEFENGNIYCFSKKAKKLDFVKYTDPPIIDSETWEAMVVLTMETWTEKFGEPEFNEKKIGRAHV